MKIGNIIMTIVEAASIATFVFAALILIAFLMDAN